MHSEVLDLTGLSLLLTVIYQLVNWHKILWKLKACLSYQGNVDTESQRSEELAAFLGDICSIFVDHSSLLCSVRYELCLDVYRNLDTYLRSMFDVFTITLSGSGQKHQLSVVDVHTAALCQEISSIFSVFDHSLASRIVQSLGSTKHHLICPNGSVAFFKSRFEVV